MNEGTTIIAERVAEEMHRIRLEQARGSAVRILTEAYVLLEEMGETELSTQLRAAGKRIGSKLKSYEHTSNRSAEGTE